MIAIDGKRLKGASKKDSYDALYAVSAFAGRSGMVLGQHEAIRAHWGIENTLHWSLDLTFGEDNSRLRKDNAATNMAIIRKAAFNALKRDRSHISLKLKRVTAAHDHTFRSSLIGH